MSHAHDKSSPYESGTTHFGFRDVPAGEKQKLVGEVFTSVAGLDYVQCNAEKLPFPDASFDLVTMAFGLRNVTDKDAALREIARVLRVGGQARVLEFSEVKAEWFRPLYDFHSFKVLPKLGSLFAGDPGSYQYLAESIRRHPPQEQLKAMMEQAGLSRCGYMNMSGGIVAVHTGYKT